MTDAPPLGRDRELAEVDRFLEQLPDGPRALALFGPAGIGKTTVWREACRRSAARGYRVLTSRPSQSETGFAFAGVADLLAPVEPTAFDSLPGVLRHAIDVALLRAEATAAVDGRATATALLRVLRRLAAERPLVLAVDDAQWLDSASTEALAFCVRRLETAPIGVLTSVRVEGLRPATFDASMPGDQRAGVDIGPLGVAALHEIVKRHLDMAMPRPTLVQIVTASGGNAFYAVEIARELVRTGLPATGAKLPLPPSLRTLVHTRVTRLPQPTKDSLLLAACLSHPTSDLVDVSSLGPAEEAGIVHFEEGGRIRFDHPLLAAAVYESSTVARRRAAHRELANRVSDPDERALHLASGASEPDEEVAALLEASASRAAARGATKMAAHLGRRAIQLTNEKDVDVRARRALTAAKHMSWAGEDPDEARVLLERCLEGTAGELRAELLYQLGIANREVGALDAGYRRLLEALDHAESAELKASIHKEAFWLAESDPPAAIAHCDAALTLIDPAANPELFGTIVLHRAYLRLITGLGADDDAVERVIHKQRPGRDTSSAVAMAWPVLHDDFTRGRAAYEEAIRVARTSGEDAAAVALLSHLGELEIWSGDWSRADALVTAAMELVERSGGATYLGTALFVRGYLDAHRGRVGAAREAGDRILQLYPPPATLALRGYWLLGFLSLSLEDYAGADRYLQSASDIIDAKGEREPARFRLHPDHVEAVIGLGDLPRARVLLERLDERARVFPRPWILATAARCRALLLAATGELDGAMSAARHALEHHAALAMPFERARTILVLGRLLRRRNERRAAREALEDCLREFERLGASIWADRARGEMARVPVRRAPSGLTPTEEKIARLASAGLTNREVAERSFVSAKTVEANLARVYDKLGVHSRAELGRVMSERERAAKT